MPIDPENLDKLTVSVAGGEDFTGDESAALCALILKRFGYELAPAAAAYRRLLGNSCPDEDFRVLASAGRLRVKITPVARPMPSTPPENSPPWLRDPRTWNDKEASFMEESMRWYAVLDSGELDEAAKAKRFQAIERVLDGIRRTCSTIPSNAAVAPRHY